MYGNIGNVAKDSKNDIADPVIGFSSPILHSAILYFFIL